MNEKNKRKADPANLARFSGKELIDFAIDSFNTCKSRIIKSTRGKGGGTYAHKNIALAYAKYLFSFESYEVRIVEDELGNPWWVAKDVCDILDINNVTMAMERIPEKHLTSIQLRSGGQIRDPSKAMADLKVNYESIGIAIHGVVTTYAISDTLGRLQEMTIISEEGLFCSCLIIPFVVY